MSNLLIVESKSKCGKIEGYLGKDYRCMASLGHIYELKKGLEAIDIDNGFRPQYQLIPSKKSVVGDLQRAAARAKIVYLAADPDREGEAIALHLAEALKISKSKLRRITFNEITKTAVQAAIKQPRLIDMQLCDAQKARRVLDRLFGFTISPVLWNHVGKSLSAGRCQSPALEIICQREDEIKQFSSNMFYSLLGELVGKIGKITVKYNEKITSLENCQDFLKLLLIAHFAVTKVHQKQRTSKPPPPHTTSTLQQEASTRLGMNPKTTMQVAQRLYEKAHITYMRTDSTILSEDAKMNITNYITNTYGGEYLTNRDYQNKKKNTQEAHECIRPVKIINSPDKMKFTENYEKRLYEIIWKRAVASQMTERRFTQQILTILASCLGTTAKIMSDILVKELTLYSDEEVTTFQGYEILYNKPLGKITDLKVGDKLTLNQFTGEERDTKPKPRYTEASLVKELERSGIGRPSTFSNIVTTLIDRNYVEFGKNSKRQVEKSILTISNTNEDINHKKVKKSATSEKGKLIATELGLRVRDFLKEHFTNILSEELTSSIEDRLDIVAEGNECWIKVVKDFYDSFYPTVVEMSKSENSSSKVARVIGEMGKYRYQIIRTKYGLALSKSDSSKKTGKSSYLPIAKELYAEGENLNVEQVKCLFKFPRKIQYSCGTQVEFCYGKNGFYLKHSYASMSLNGDYSNNSSPDEIQMGTFLETINENRVDENGDAKPKKGIIKKLKDYNICNGPYGPFIAKTKGKSKPVSIPNDKDPESLTEEDCKALFNKKYQKNKY